MSDLVTILAINGPNLNMLGTREPEIYGADTLADMEARCRDICDAEGASLEWMQTNGEADIVTAIQDASGKFDWIVINAAGLTHCSVPLRDALALFPGPQDRGPSFKYSQARILPPSFHDLGGRRRGRAWIRCHVLCHGDQGRNRYGEGVQINGKSPEKTKVRQTPRWSRHWQISLMRPAWPNWNMKLPTCRSGCRVSAARPLSPRCRSRPGSRRSGTCRRRRTCAGTGRRQRRCRLAPRSRDLANGRHGLCRAGTGCAKLSSRSATR